MKSVPRNTHFWICIEVVFIFVLVEVLPRDGPRPGRSPESFRGTVADTCLRRGFGRQATRSGTATLPRNKEAGRV